MSKLLDYSEQITGLILMGRQTVTGFNPEKFAGDYQHIVRGLKDGKTKEQLVLKYSNSIQTAETAAHRVNGLGETLDYSELLNMAYVDEICEQDTQKALRYLQNGETEKYNDILRKITATRQGSQRLRSVLASEISDNYEAYIPSGSKVWDKELGGIPNVGLVVIGAKTFTGKTTLAISLMEQFLKEYPSKKILFVTLEDMNEGWKFRAKQILGDRSKDFWERIRVMEFAENSQSIIDEAARFEDVGAIFVDYLEYMVNESDVSSYTEVYKALSTGAKSLAVANKFRSMPIFLLAQFGKTLYKGGVPTPDALPYVDQRFIYQQIMLYQPDGDFYSDNPENAYTLPVVKEKGYIICWKSKNARPHGEDFPGAIQVNWNPKYGYDLAGGGEWFSLSAETKKPVEPRKK